MRCAPRARSGGAAPRARAEHLSIYRMAHVRPGVQQVTAQRNGPLRLPKSDQSPAQSVGDVGWRRGMGTRSSWVVRSVCRAPASQPCNPPGACEPGCHAAARPNEADGGWGETRRPASQRAQAMPGRANVPRSGHACLYGFATEHPPPTHLPRRATSAFSHASFACACTPQRFSMIWRLRRAFSDEKECTRHTDGVVSSLLSVVEFDRSTMRAEPNQNGGIEFRLESKMRLLSLSL